ncbi:MAG: thiol reductant ABC exporter subunit CydC [Bacteroidales bacterium]|nr:thiol reductant ABC exporter subunit CydC [Bacteroidales bacterium]MCF8333074.1 thiol reductant ABC exporter subunit CydC [Bacteroidales bacterium]
MIIKVIGFLKKYKLRFAGAALLAIGTVLAGIGLMSTSGYLISRAAERPIITDLFMVTAAVRFFGISRAVVRYAERLASHDLTFKILMSIRYTLFRKIDQSPVKQLMGKRHGDLLSRLVNDIETLQNVYLKIVSPVITAGVVTGIVFVLLLFVDVVLALIALAFLISNAVLIPLLAHRIAKGRGKSEVQTKSDLSAFLVDRLQGLYELFWTRQKTSTEKQFNGMQSRLDQVERKNAGATGMLEGLNNAFSQLAMFTVLIFAIPLVLNGQLQGVMLAMVTLGVLSSFEAVQNLGNAFLHYETAEQAAGRVFALTEQEPDRRGKSNMAVDSLESIAFRKVSFSYTKENITLSDINFSIPAGNRVAVVGPSGCGKSTLLNLLLRFWYPDKGKILYGNRDIYDLDEEQYRKMFAVISQDEHIFNRTLRDNLLLANPEASDEQLRTALHKAGLGAYANQLDLELGNFGMRFSGGERQLLFIARALLKDAPIWVFDEATAHMDAQTEQNVHRILEANLHGRSLLFITHRLIGMDKMHQILAMQDGKIVERGTHKELLQKQGLYAKMYHLQNELIPEA